MNKKDEIQPAAKKTLGIISHFISTFLIALVVMIAAILAAVRFAGLELLNVESASMEPSLSVNTLVVVKEVDPDTIETGDVITYVMNADLMLVTHRVVYIDRENETFTTKGDANNTTDPTPVLWGNVVGKVVFSIPKMGAVVSAISAEQNRAYVLCALAVMVGAVVISDFVESALRRRRQKSAAEPARNTVRAKTQADTDAAPACDDGQEKN